MKKGAETFCGYTHALYNYKQGKDDIMNKETIEKGHFERIFLLL